MTGVFLESGTAFGWKRQVGSGSVGVVSEAVAVADVERIFGSPRNPHFLFCSILSPPPSHEI